MGAINQLADCVGNGSPAQTGQTGESQCTGAALVMFVSLALAIMM